MKKCLQKIAIVLGVAVILSSSFYPSAMISVAQVEDTGKAGLQFYQNIGDVTVKKQNSVFLQEAENGGIVLWDWKQNEQKSYLTGTKNYWNKQGNLEKSKLKVKISKKNTQSFKYVLSFMKESAQGEIYLFFEKKNQQKSMYIVASKDGTIKQRGIIDLKILGKKKQYTLDDMKIVNKNKIGILYSDLSNKEETKKKVLFVNTKNGTANNKTDIEWNKNKSEFLKSSFLWEGDFIYSVQGSKILIINSERQDKRLIEIPKEFHDFSVCMSGNTIFLFDLEKGVYYYNMESSNQLEQMDSAIPNINGNYKVAAVTVTKEKDIMYISLSKEVFAGEEQEQSYQILKYQLGQTEKPMKIISADYKEYSLAQELVADADWIFSGTVKNIIYENLNIGTTSDRDSFMPYTIFEIDVSKVYKGDIKDKTVYIKRLGGISDFTICEVAGAPKIEYGNRYLFVAETFENSYPSLLNLNQCTFNLDTETEDTQHRGITYSQILKAVG